MILEIIASLLIFLAAVAIILASAEAEHRKKVHSARKRLWNRRMSCIFATTDLKK